MINAPTNAASAEVTAIDTQARGPLLLLLGSGLVWLVASGILALITSIQLHTPAFMADCEWLTFGRAQALRETAFVYGWCANAGLAVALWVLGRLGGYPLRGLNWVVVGTLFWNLGITAALSSMSPSDCATEQTGTTARIDSVVWFVSGGLFWRRRFCSSGSRGA